MIDRAQIENIITSLPNVELIYPFGEDIAVYQLSTTSQADNDRSAMFALIEKGNRPVLLSVRCDPGLAQLLREKYETVLPGNNLNKNRWNTIICTGQVPIDELKDFIRHSYELAKSSTTEAA